MFRTGIWTVEQFLEAEKRPGRKSGTVSICLSDVNDDAGPEAIRIFEAVSGALRTSNGTYRTTYPHRFKDVDTAAQIQIQRVFGPKDAFEVQDRAASTCLTSAEWAGVVFPFFENVRFVASDRLLFLIEAELPTGEIFILEPVGEPLQYIRPPFVLSLVAGESRWHIALRPLLRHLRGKLRGLQIPADWIHQPDTTEFLIPPWKLKRIPLTHPRARSLANADPRFHLTNASVFDATPGACQVLRTMNILNRSYFAEERLREGIQSSLDTLTENGIWIVGRTLEEPRMGNHATIFRKRKNAFEVLERIGGGWELETWALSAGEKSRITVPPG